MIKKTAASISLLLAACGSVQAADSAPESKVTSAGVPFMFSSENWGLALGGAGIVTGIGQPQMSIFGTAILSDNGTTLGYVGLQNMMIPGLDNLLVTVNGQYADFKQMDYYLPGNPNFAGEKPGSNDSSQDNFVTTASIEQRYSARFRYILPIGQGEKGALAALRAGSDPKAGRSWNPLDHGVTSVELQPFYESQQLDKYSATAGADTAAGLKLILDYDNRNSSQLPTRGSQTTFTWTQDWGSDDRPEWSTWEFEFSKFFDLGSNDLMEHQVIAMNAWIADTPTWNETSTINGETQYNRAPYFSGVSLGGWDKLRGYSTDRFYGRSAVSYSLELRAQPRWQPMEDMPVLGPLYSIPWWQWTLFVDAGRVADEFDLSELHSDMKYSFGGGIRFQVEGVTVRTEVASGDEGAQLRIFFNQPF